jgi:hypothetical protein
MSSVEEVIAEALRWSNGNDGLDDWSREARDVVAALSAAGFVITQLPEPPWKYALGEGDIEDLYSRDGLVVVSGVDAISPAYARELAAALLAAAFEAEKTGEVL